LEILCIPPLVWAGAIARVHGASVLSTLIFILFDSLSYSVWGLASATIWEDRVESRQIFIRCVFVSWFFLSLLIYLPLNPVAFLLFHLGSLELGAPFGWGWQGSVTATHILFHLLLLVSGLLVYGHAMNKRKTLIER